jgi:gas vesicle protein
MNRWQSILMGLVLSALLGVAIALAVSDERRRQLSHRLEELRKALPRMEQLKQSAQQAATKAREAGSDLGGQVQESASKLGQRTQEMVSVAQQTATDAREERVLIS